MVLRNFVATAFYVFLAFVLVLVGARFLALLFEANPESEIVERIYRHSDFWVKPFFGMFDLSNEAVEGGGLFEPASLIAFAVYLGAGLVVMTLLSGIPTMGRTHHA